MSGRSDAMRLSIPSGYGVQAESVPIQRPNQTAPLARVLELWMLEAIVETFLEIAPPAGPSTANSLAGWSAWIAARKAPPELPGRGLDAFGRISSIKVLSSHFSLAIRQAFC